MNIIFVLYNLCITYEQESMCIIFAVQFSHIIFVLYNLCNYFYAFISCITYEEIIYT